MTVPMTVSLFLHCAGAVADPAAFPTAVCAGPGRALAAIDGVTSVELYTPLEISDPMVDDGTGPPLVIQIRFAAPVAAETALHGNALAAALSEFQALPIRDWHVRYDVVLGEPVAGAGETDPATTAVPVCYLVRYERPARDEARFIARYRASHPPIMARLPDIRRCEIYTPLDWADAPAIERADHMLICDTSFETADALNAALRSKVRDRLREDYRSLPPFDGRCTHFGMRRTRLSECGGPACRNAADPPVAPKMAAGRTAAGAARP